jgi:hypothetical protein
MLHPVCPLALPASLSRFFRLFDSGGCEGEGEGGMHPVGVFVTHLKKVHAGGEGRRGEGGGVGGFGHFFYLSMVCVLRIRQARRAIAVKLLGKKFS